MRIMAKRSSVALFCLLTLVAFAAEKLRADDVPVAPVEMATVAVKSLDALTAFAKEAGIPLPPFLTKEGLEKQFVFIGNDGLDSGKPIGIIFFGAPKTPPTNLVTFVFPIKPAGASIESLKAMGGVPMPGQADTVVLNGAVGLRRTGDYLIFSPSAAAVVAFKPQAFSEVVKGADALAKLTVNVAAIREASPELLAAFIDNVEKQSANDLANNQNKPGYAVGQDLVLNWLRDSAKTLNRLDIGVDADDRSLRLSASGSPVKAAPAVSFNRPGMPAGVVGRIDSTISFGRDYPKMREDLESFVTESIKKESKDKVYTEEDLKQMRSAMSRMLGLAVDSTTASVGVEMSSGKPVVYLVQHWPEKFDGISRIREVARDLSKMAEKEKDASSLEIKPYEADGKSILRIKIIEKGKTIGCVDAYQSGDEMYYAISTDEERHMPKLLAAPKEGPEKDILSAVIDLGKSIEAAAAIPDSGLSDMPADLRKNLTESLRGRKVKLSLSNHDGAATVDLTADREILKIIRKFAEK